MTREDRIKSRSRQRRKDQREEVRQAILQAAAALFLENGYEGFSLREVAETIGYSPGTIYLYFDGKDDILFTIADEGYQEFLRVLRQARAESDAPVRQLRLMGDAYVRFGMANPTRYRLMFMERPDFILRESASGGPGWQESFHQLQETVASGMADGTMQANDAEQAADAIWSALHGVVALGVSMPHFDADRVQASWKTVGYMVARTFFPQILTS